MILPVDREAINHYNKKQLSKSTMIVIDSIPSPFIGNPSSARLVLLNLNPGHSKKDLLDQHDPNFRKAMILTLKHELQDFPFYPLNPAFKHTGGGEWWNTILGPLKRELQLDDATLSRMLMVIEWFPYHSTRSGLPRSYICKSQEYSFYLAKKMIHKSDAIIIGMRSREHWCTTIPEFEKVCFLTNTQRPWISKGNMDEHLFERIIKRLRQ
jgi:hypothetical protein